MPETKNLYENDQLISNRNVNIKSTLISVLY